MRQSCIAWVIGVSLLSATAQAQAPAQKICGYYVGDFVADHEKQDKHPMYVNKINISIDSIQQEKVKGHSVVAGNNRPFSGTLSKKDSCYVVRAKEPGDDQYDGVFEFVVDPNSHEMSGSWTANDKKLAVTRRKYRLERKVFVYNPKQALDIRDLGFMGGKVPVYDSYNQATDKSEAITSDACKVNASTTRLSSRDVENLYKTDLEVMRNTIYARHGYSFQNRAMRSFFDHIPWYIPVTIDVTKELTDIEKSNIEILKRYENHASTYYDRFGR